MNSNKLANSLIRRKPNIRAAVLQGARLRMVYDPPKLEMWLGKTMRDIYLSIQLPAKMAPNIMSRDSAVVAAYKTDPFNHGRITPAWFFSAFDAQSYAIDHAATISVPTLVMHGTDDKVASSIVLRI